MSIHEYIICGPGRCGGNLLMGLIQATGAKAIRTHNVDYTTNNDQTTAWIRVDRREIFDAVCSNIIANRVGQTTHYNRTVIQPFYVGQTEFQEFYQKHLDYRQDYWSVRNFARTDLFWYEDFAQNWETVWTRLGLTVNDALLENIDIKRYINVPAPYNYRNIIINYEELKKYVIY